MTGASMFWRDALHGCNLDRSLPLPYDRYRLSGEQRSGRGTTVSFDFGQDLSHTFLAHASSNGIHPQHLALACYYAFLFKMTNGERDLCIGMNVNNRYRDEFKSVIGLFENIIPLRCQLDSSWSFGQLVEHVDSIMTSSVEYSYYPLQRILAQHPTSANSTFLDISFHFRSDENKSNKKYVRMGDGRLCVLPTTLERNEDEITNKFDFTLAIQHDLEIDQLSSTMTASLDLFNSSTIANVTQRFSLMLKQLFQTSSLIE